MSTETVKRFDRIVALLVQLQSKRIVKAQELADRFEVSLRTIYRDVRTLEACGVPIVSEAGVGYSIMEGYRLPPVMFTKEEASSFVAAEKFMRQFLDKTLGDYHESAMYKIKSVLRGNEKDWINALESHITVAPTDDLFNSALPDALEILFESIAEKKQVFLKYQSLESETPSERHIEPVGLFHEKGFWYFMAYCHKRRAYRQFRTDRMLGIARTLQYFTREHASLDTYRTSWDADEMMTIKIRVDKKVARFMQSSRKQYGFVHETVLKDAVEMTFSTCDFHQGFPRWYLSFSDYCTILQPQSVKDRVQQIMKEGLERLR